MLTMSQYQKKIYIYICALQLLLACFKCNVIIIVPSQIDRQTIPDKMAESWNLPPLIVPPNLIAKRYVRKHLLQDHPILIYIYIYIYIRRMGCSSIR